MDNKVVIQGGKKEEIVTAALDLFFEYGYEYTSIRMIQARVKSSVGLFYRYYKSKDDVFEAAIRLFFRKYEEEMQRIVDDDANNLQHALSTYINYIDDATQDFRKKYLKKMHWSILGAIREYTLRIMRKYVFLIIKSFHKKNIIKTEEHELEIVANFIAYAVGGSILYQDKQNYNNQKKDIFLIISNLLGISEF